MLGDQKGGAQNDVGEVAEGQEVERMVVLLRKEVVMRKERRMRRDLRRLECGRREVD